jgi:beta-galactosidase
MGDRRRLAVAPSIAAVLAVLGSHGAAIGHEARETIWLSDGWRFLQDDRVTGAEEPRFVDDAWAAVRVPHTWNRVGRSTLEPASQSPPTNETRGIGWYRLRFEVPRRFAGRKLWLQFDAASSLAEVWLNGNRLGEHRGGFSRFRFDATNAIRVAHRNTLVVKTDNSIPTADSETGDILPLCADFFEYGGLYRPVSLIATAPIHVDMLDHGGPGVYIRTQEIDGNSAKLSIETRLDNDQPAGSSAELVLTIRERTGRLVASSRRTVRLGPQASADVVEALRIADVHLWQGVADPYLYDVAVEIRSPSGALLDRIVQPYGVRRIVIDPDRGLLLNGIPVRLHGVDLQQDRDGKGWAVSAADQREDMAAIVEMGANTIRFTHYQHSDDLNGFADQSGLLDWLEIPLVTRWTHGASLRPTRALVDNAKQQLVELIRQSMNHPSVAVWGIGNEIDFGVWIPRGYGGERTAGLDPLPLLKVLRDVAHAEDPSRPTAIANCCYGRPSAPSVIDSADVSGANRFFGWYYGVPSDLQSTLAAMHDAHPDIPLALSEYGAGGAVSQSTDNPLGGPIEAFGHAQPEDYQSHIHEITWPIVEGLPYLWGSWIAFMFDFSTPLHIEADSVHINTKGLVTYDRKTRKDAFYFYKANWTMTPTVHIANRRYARRVLPVTDVKVYSNAPSTEAWVNGRHIGALADCPHRVCVWRGIPLASGENVVRAVGFFPSGTRQDSVSWELTVPEDVYRIDCGALEGQPGPGGPYASDDLFTGGSAAAIPMPTGRSMGDTALRSILDTYRKGSFFYRLPLANGNYRIRVWFVEPQFLPGERVFSVLANGASMISNIDVADAAGGPLKPLERTFDVQVERGVLQLDFVGSKRDAIVSAIDVEPVPVPARPDG